MPLNEVTPDETLMKQGRRPRLVSRRHNVRHLQRIAHIRAQDHIFNFHPSALRSLQLLCLVSVLLITPHI